MKAPNVGPSLRSGNMRGLNLFFLSGRWPLCVPAYLVARALESDSLSVRKLDQAYQSGLVGTFELAGQSRPVFSLGDILNSRGEQSSLLIIRTGATGGGELVGLLTGKLLDVKRVDEKSLNAFPGGLTPTHSGAFVGAYPNGVMAGGKHSTKRPVLKLDLAHVLSQVDVKEAMNVARTSTKQVSS